MTLPTLHLNFDPIGRVEAVLGESFGVCFWVPESGSYTIAKMSDFNSDCRFGIFDHGNIKGGWGTEKNLGSPI